MFVEENNLIYRRFSGDVFKELSKFGEFVLDSVVVEDESKRVYRFKDGTQYLYTGWTIERVEGVEEPNRQWTTKRAKVREVKSNYSFPKGIRLDFQTGDSMASQPFAGGVIELSTKPVFVLVEDPKP